MAPPFLQLVMRTARQVYPHATWSDRGQRVLFVGRCLWHHRAAQRWLEYLATGPLEPVARANPSLYRKPIRPYVSVNWPARAKVAAMINHYEFLAARLGAAPFRLATSPAGAVLLEFGTRDGDRLVVQLRYDGKFRKEGESTLDLESTRHGCRVASLTFVCAASPAGAPCLVIGAVSGLPAGADKEIIKHTAKALFGLRPKALLLLVVQELAGAWGVAGLLGAGSRIHSSRHLVYALNRRRRFAIAYDEFWREAGGFPRSDGFFVLPLRPPVRAVESIAAHKRSLYRQRQALVADLQAGVRARLGSWQPGPALSAAAAGDDRTALRPAPKIGSQLVAGIAFAASLALAVGLRADPAPWSLHGQATVIEQWHGDFWSPYAGRNSLQADREDQHTATLTLFLGHELWPGAELYFDPEVTQGNGLSGTVGVAGFPNGEATRAGSGTPEYNTARLFLRQTFGFGGPPEKLEPAANQVAVAPERDRLTLTLGKMSAVDLLDANAYSHDPRTQLLNWALMDNGAWDYPADTKGYTIGATADLHLAVRSWRWGIFLEPAEANGRRLDPHLARAFGQAGEWEERFALAGRPAVLRALVYWNRAHMGSYAAALQSAAGGVPDLVPSRRYRSKAGAGVNWEQELAPGFGLFARAGFNDGHSETWAFTEIDRTASAGVSLKGAAWHRPDDTLALAVVGNGLAGDHRRYLAAGGYGFIAGDGTLNYGAEEILEGIYEWKTAGWPAVAADCQLVRHPAYNRDRGPVPLYALRLHEEF